MNKTIASTITSNRSLKCATFHLTRWRLMHSKELPGNLPAPLVCHALALRMTEMQLSDAIALTSMLLRSAQFRILLTMPTLWQTMLLRHWPPQPQYDSHSSMKKKWLSSMMDGLLIKSSRSLSNYCQTLLMYYYQISYL